MNAEDFEIMNIQIEHRNPTLREYQILRGSTGWEDLDDTTVEKGLENSLFAVCAIAGGQTVGIGRIIGDGAIYFYIQDVIVMPAFHKMGIGDRIMRELEEWLNKNTYRHSFIGLMAAEGVKDFYTRFGYLERGSSRPGMNKLRK
ncbi:MAG: GNAT family N-acetyltransferase [Christiangramia sp.]|nr:GNAT family N-acetyltransferase [Christiangramia sp.]